MLFLSVFIIILFYLNCKFGFWRNFNFRHFFISYSLNCTFVLMFKLEVSLHDFGSLEFFSQFHLMSFSIKFTILLRCKVHIAVRKSSVEIPKTKKDFLPWKKVSSCSLRKVSLPVGKWFQSRRRGTWRTKRSSSTWRSSSSWGHPCCCSCCCCCSSRFRWK